MVTEDELWAQLRNLHDRVARLAALEAADAPYNGMNADGRHLPTKKALLDQAEAVINKLERLLLGNPPA